MTSGAGSPETAAIGSAAAEIDCSPATEVSGLTGVRPETAEAMVDLLSPGGGWGGCEAPVLRAIAIAERHGLVVTSLKRNWGNPGSDHHLSQETSFAADLSNGTAPTPEMDAAAAELAHELDQPDWPGGLFTTDVVNGLRAQLIWRWEGHFNHIHFGVRSFNGGGRRTLQRDDVGDDVADLQRRLNDAGCPCQVDGHFGEETEAAVRQFQQMRGLHDDGIVGPLTWAALGG